MKKVSEVLGDKIEKFIAEMQKDKGYSGFLTNVTIEDQDALGKVTFKSNSGMWLPNSTSAELVIKEFINEELKNADDCFSAIINIQFSKNKINNTMQKPNDITKEEFAIFQPEEPKFKMRDVVLTEETEKQIGDAISTIENFDIVYDTWNFKSKEPSSKTNICFYGAPGTGKTMCAHAIAKSLGKKILIASYADIQSQYVGVGPKNLKAVFKKAEEEKALLFFDEADSFLRKRTSDNSSSASMHYNSMTNEMMKHLEDFTGIVIFATNLTENMDEAFKTRLSFSVEFKIPDDKGRQRIIKGMIPKEVPLAQEFSDKDFAEMSKVCDGLVGRDIRNAIKTILSVGARNKTYPFSVEHFINGFNEYRENKKSFDNGSGKKSSNVNPMDIYTANGCIHELLTYAALLDGPETEKESEYIKLFSKILNRTKLTISSVKDLPELEEICFEIKDDELKNKAMRYLTFFMANTEQDEAMYLELVSKLQAMLRISDEYVADLKSYYSQLKEISNFKNNKLKIQKES